MPFLWKWFKLACIMSNMLMENSIFCSTWVAFKPFVLYCNKNIVNLPQTSHCVFWLCVSYNQKTQWIILQPQQPPALERSESRMWFQHTSSTGLHLHFQLFNPLLFKPHCFPPSNSKALPRFLQIFRVSLLNFFSKTQFFVRGYKPASSAN